MEFPSCEQGQDVNFGQRSSPRTDQAWPSKVRGSRYVTFYPCRGVPQILAINCHIVSGTLNFANPIQMVEFNWDQCDKKVMKKVHILFHLHNVLVHSHAMLMSIGIVDGS